MDSPLYHCAELENAWAIENEGFRSFPETFGDFDPLYHTVLNWFTPEELKRVTDAYPDRAKKAAAWNIFLKRFGRGTLIHLAKEPLFDYGDACYEVTLPKGSLIAPYVAAQEGFLAWIPRRPIPSKYVKRMRDL